MGCKDVEEIDWMDVAIKIKTYGYFIQINQETLLWNSQLNITRR